MSGWFESNEDRTHAFSAIPRHVSTSRSLREEGVAFVISPGESVVVESRWNVWSAICSCRPEAASSGLGDK